MLCFRLVFRFLLPFCFFPPACREEREAPLCFTSSVEELGRPSSAERRIERILLSVRLREELQSTEGHEEELAEEEEYCRSALPPLARPRLPPRPRALPTAMRCGPVAPPSFLPNTPFHLDLRCGLHAAGSDFHSSLASMGGRSLPLPRPRLSLPLFLPLWWGSASRMCATPLGRKGLRVAMLLPR